MKSKLVGLTFLFGCVVVNALPWGQADQENEHSAQVVSLRIEPQRVTIWGDQGSQRFLVLAEYADELERDVTSGARFSLFAPDMGEMDASGKFTSRAKGRVMITAQFGGRVAKAA